MVKQVDLSLTRFKNFPARVTFVQRSVWYRSQFACATHPALTGRSASPQDTWSHFRKPTLDWCRSEILAMLVAMRKRADVARGPSSEQPSAQEADREPFVRLRTVGSSRAAVGCYHLGKAHVTLVR